jgi:6-phosphogluconolactonase
MAASDEHQHADPARLADAVAGRLAEALRLTLSACGVASLAVPGGRTPGPVFDRLSQAALDWGRVTVTLTDERWVPAAHMDSNERLLRERLLQGEAAHARLLGLYRNTALPSEAQSEVERDLATLADPFAVVLLGMGEDGHFASLFPGSAALRQGLDLRQTRRCLAIDEPCCGHPRMTLSLSRLVAARVVVLMFQGRAKYRMIEAAWTGAGEVPVAALLRQRRAPVEVHWCP